MKAMMVSSPTLAWANCNICAAPGDSCGAEGLAVAAEELPVETEFWARDGIPEAAQTATNRTNITFCQLFVFIKFARIIFITCTCQLLIQPPWPHLAGKMPWAARWRSKQPQDSCTTAEGRTGVRRHLK
jgi:hypothetical protein